MGRNYQLSILSPDKTLYEGKAQSVVVPSALGYLGVLADHAPLAANLVPGKIAVRDEAGKQFNFLCEKQGFVEVSNNQVNVILT